MKKICLMLLFLFSCNKEEPQINNPNAIFNTSGWVVKTYTINNNPSNVFNNYTFEFTDNPIPGCPEYMDGKSPLGVFGGYYEITYADKTIKFKIILGPAFNLNQIIGVWNVIVINNNTIHLVRLNNQDNQVLVLNR